MHHLTFRALLSLTLMAMPTAILPAGCSGSTPPADAATAESGPAIEVDKPETATLVVSTERTYKEPERPADDREKVDIGAMCGALAGCAKSRCSDDDYARAVMATSPKTPWGKLLKEHLAGADQHRACRRMVKLLREDNLASISPDCAYLMRHCG